MKRLLVAVLGAVLTMTLLQAPAQAHGADGDYVHNACVAFDGTLGAIRRKETCAAVWWRDQGNGDGVTLEFLDVHTVDGGSLLNGYTKVRAKWQNTSIGILVESWDWNVEPDNFTKNHDSVRGTDIGAMDYRLNMCAGDDHLWFHYRLFSGGNGVTLDKGHEEDSYCD